MRPHSTLLTLLLLSVLFELLAGRVITGYILALRGIRVILGITSGAVLGSTGAALQRVYNNPLADGYILGISGGAIFGVSLAELLHIPTLDFLWALLGSVLVGFFLMIFVGKVDRLLVPVFGIGLGMFFSSLAVLLFMMSGVEATRTFYALWGTLGRFYEYDDLLIVLLLLFSSLFGIAYIVKYDRDMDAVSLGDEEALALGYDPRATVLKTTVASAILVALVTSFVGVIGFVGIMSAHILRSLGVREGKSFYIFSGVVGSILILLSDGLGRLVLGIDPPIGIIMSIIGAPFFVYLTVKRA